MSFVVIVAVVVVVHFEPIANPLSLQLSIVAHRTTPIVKQAELIVLDWPHIVFSLTLIQKCFFFLVRFFFLFQRYYLALKFL